MHERVVEPLARAVAELARGAGREHAIAQLAAAQHGVASFRQLVVLGLGRGSIDHRARTGRLHRIHTGVYAVGHPRLSALGHAMAAVLACGDGTALSHRSAAWNRALRPFAPSRHDVIVPTAGGRAQPRIRVHRAPGLLPEEVEVVDGIPTTTVARTLLDLGEVLTVPRLLRVIDQAEVNQVFDLRAVQRVLDAHPGHHGTGTLLAALREAERGPQLTRSELEALYLRICADHGLPRPAVNAHIAGLEVDAVFVAERVAVEIDHAHWHGTRLRAERDYERELILTVAGFRPLRFSQRQLTRHPTAVAHATRAALAGLRPPPAPAAASTPRAPASRPPSTDPRPARRARRG